MKDFAAVTEFLFELDALKAVERKSYIQGGVRLENSAEHSWHLAVACWSLAEYFQLRVDQEKLLKLALVHDLGETDGGDTFLYSSARSDAHHHERACITRLSNLGGNPISELGLYWEEQETGHSPETKLLKAVDRLLPFLLNIKSDGRAWREHGICRSQVAQAHAFIKHDFPEMHAWLSAQIQAAVEQGWLKGE